MTSEPRFDHGCLRYVEPVLLTGRWTPERKSWLLAALENRELTAAQALSRYQLSVEELDLWLAAHRRAGRNGLKVTAIQTQGRLV